MFYQAGDDNSQLSNLLLSTGGLSPTFMSTTYNYTHSTNSTFATFTPTASNPSASISVHGNPVVSGSASAAVPLVIGANPINTIVTALDGSTTNYIVTITRLSSSPISLNNISKFVDDPPFNITNPPSLSSGAFSYTSSDTSVATISGNTVTIQGLGASTITVTQAAAGSYVSATTTATLTVTENLNDPVVAFEAIKTEIESITKNGTISNSVEQVKNAEFIMREKMVFHGEMMRAEPSTATTSFVDYNFNFNGDSFGIVGAGKYHQTDIGGDQFRRRIMIDAKRVHSKNQSVTQVVSALSLFDVGISEKTSSQYRFGFKQSDGKGNHPITSSSNARSYRVGGSLSHSFNEKVFGGVFGDFIYTRTKSSFQSTYTNVIGKIRTYSVSGGAQLAGQYEVYAEFWIKPSVALSYSREHLIKKRFISTTSLGSTVVEAALPMPTVLRITIEPEFLYESSANHNKTKDFASVNPSYACESIKSRDKVDVCNTGIYFQIGRKSDEKGITGKFYFSYENLNSGPKHEYGLQFKANL
jgi:voltage-gated potassium channel Kch